MANHKYQTSNELNAGATKRNSAHMLPVSDWLSDLPENTQLTDLIEVQFKNTRKGYFHKDYPVETLVHLFLGTLCFVMSYWFWRGFWLMGLGFCLAWLINILVEWAWAKWHNYYNYYNNK